MTKGHSITITPADRHVEIVVNGEKVAESDRPVLLEETGLPTRYYLPREDVRADALRPTATESVCPFKGQASYWSVEAGGETHDDLVWSYESPIPATRALERALQHLDHELAVRRTRHRRHVEPQRGTARVVLGEPAGGEHPQTALLRCRHRFDRRAEAGAAARLDLAEHERRVAADHEVELAVATAPVSIEHAVAGRFVPGGDSILAGVPETAAGIHPAPMSRAGHR